MDLPAPPTPTRQERESPFGGWTYNAALVCRHCQVKGYVRTRRVFFETLAECQNCRTAWTFGART